MSEVGLGPTLGLLELGTLFSTVLYGTVLVQAYNYYHAQFKGDSTIIKYLVGLVCVLESLHTAVLWIYLYSRTVDNFGNRAALNEVHWALAVSVPISTLIVLFVESFFAYRIFILSRSPYFSVLAVLGLLVRLGLGAAFAGTSIGFKINTYLEEFKWLVTSALAVGAVVDVAITVALCIVLRSNTTVQPRTKQIIDKLVLWTIETGLLTSICAIIEVILMQTKDNLLWAFFFFMSAKFYSNSLLASLNGRVLLQLIQQDPTSISRSLALQSMEARSFSQRNLEVHVAMDVETASDPTAQHQQPQKSMGIS
ncbi:hypothetical protein K435DRAFT_777609 [Dendrothele bispora CBS 962.96]|uniref:DUF6534 domain-containing protein n=1 Tax=Dendrothele bispora (strain CBS 962.96) TaxID=1314807 RepID=A0A4S8M826_DENBC|nr:hypothetical protein K435DRAFT_777609 [Dendrothele bispora CBS 962.96]